MSHLGAYGRASSAGFEISLPRVLFIHTGARSARLDNKEILLDLLRDLSAQFYASKTSTQSDLVQDTCDLAAALEGSGLVGAGSGDENHVCVGLYDIRTGTAQYAALLATSVHTPSRAIPSLMKDQDVSPILVGSEADRYYQALAFTHENTSTNSLSATTSNVLTDTIGLITFDPVAGLLLGLTSSTKPSTANRGRVPPSCLPRVGLEIQRGDRHLCGLCTGFTDSMLLGHASVGDMLRQIDRKRDSQNKMLLNPLPPINSHVDFFSLAVGSSPEVCFPPQLFTSCALGGEAFIYSWGPTADTTIVSTVS